jgi:hypothetical protein
VQSLETKFSPTKLGLVLAAALSLLAVSAAQAADPVVEEARKSYREQVEPICKSSTQSNSKILKGVEGQVNKGALAPAGRRFLRASTVFGRAVKKIAKVPRPSTDAAALGKWVGLLKEQGSWLRKIGQALKAEKEGKARTYAQKLDRSNKAANRTVFEFEFRHCEIDSSKFL